MEWNGTLVAERLGGVGKLLNSGAEVVHHALLLKEGAHCFGARRLAIEAVERHAQGLHAASDVSRFVRLIAHAEIESGHIRRRDEGPLFIRSWHLDGRRSIAPTCPVGSVSGRFAGR